jgi:hypothetical protein
MRVKGHTRLEEPMKHALLRLNSSCYIALFATLSIALMIVGLALACFCE